MNFKKLLKGIRTSKEVLVTSLLVSVIVTGISLTVVFGVLYKNKVSLANFVISSYSNRPSETNTTKEENNNEETEEAVTANLPDIIQNVFTQESHIINLVKVANPAVVSIVVSKDVPVVEQYFSNPFGDLWGSGFVIPQLRQNGTERKEIAAGSGFIVSSDGLVITNRHVVNENNASYTLYTSDEKSYEVEVLAKDSYLDIAVLKIKSNSKFPFLKFGNSDEIELGQSVVAIGNALGEFRNSVSVGVISGLSRSITAGDGNGNSEFLEKVIQTDAAINHGNSGGPLLNINGEVIGVNVAVAEGSENIGFALPANAVKSALQSVRETGEIARPYLGVRFLAIDKTLQEKNNIPVDYGVIVVGGNNQNEPAVLPNSPAEKAGLIVNDIILEIDGVRLNKNNTLLSVIQEKSVGDKVELRVMRNGSIILLYATLEKSGV